MAPEQVVEKWNTTFDPERRLDIFWRKNLSLSMKD